jgi:hypothetical protein
LGWAGQIFFNGNFIGLGSLLKARNLWGKEKEHEEEMERKKKKRKKEKKMLGWAGQVLEEKNKKSDFVDLLCVLLGMGQADLPMCQYGSENWFSLTLVNL